MATAYVDASVLVAVEFNQEGGAEALDRMNGFSEIHSSNLA